MTRDVAQIYLLSLYRNQINEKSFNLYSCSALPLDFAKTLISKTFDLNYALFQFHLYFWNRHKSCKTFIGSQKEIYHLSNWSDISKQEIYVAICKI